MKYLIDSTDVINKTWETANGLLSLAYWPNGFELTLQSPKMPIQKILPHNIRGLPHNSIKPLTTAQMAAYLSDTYVKISNTSSGEAVVEISCRLKGGANIIDPVTARHKLWPGAIVPYTIDGRLSLAKRETIQGAINEWNGADTGFTLRPRSRERDYLTFSNAAGICNSNVGRVGGQQYISCDLRHGFDQGSLKHEIAHAIGFYHEHQRSDRDDHVNVISRNYQNYRRIEGKTFSWYDFHSIMHYPFHAEKLMPRNMLRPDIDKIGNTGILSPGDLAASNYLADFATGRRVR